MSRERRRRGGDREAGEGDEQQRTGDVVAPPTRHGSIREEPCGADAEQQTRQRPPRCAAGGLPDVDRELCHQAQVDDSIERSGVSSRDSQHHESEEQAEIDTGTALTDDERRVTHDPGAGSCLVADRGREIAQHRYRGSVTAVTRGSSPSPTSSMSSSGGTSADLSSSLAKTASAIVDDVGDGAMPNTSPGSPS